jgi:hypothetical protein
MSIELKSGASTDLATVDPTSKAVRVSTYSAEGVEVSAESKDTFFATNTFTPAATPTDLVTIYGSATKTVRVVKFVITTTNTAAGSQTFFLIKRSAVNTTGTFVAATAVPSDSSDSAATATVGHYTANPGGLGTAVGTTNIKRVASPVLIPASFAGIVDDAGFDMLDSQINADWDKSIVLRGVAQGLCLNFNGAALVSGQVHAFQVIWTEE